ncbi:actin-related protein 2/3 complex subunit 1A-like [Synchiropus picturatus]
MLFRCDDGGSLTFVSKLDLPKQSVQRNMSAMERFRNLDKRATTEDRNAALETLHQNSVTQVSIYEGDKRGLSQVLHHRHRRRHDHLGLQESRSFYPGPAHHVKPGE